MRSTRRWYRQGKPERCRRSARLLDKSFEEDLKRCRRFAAPFCVYDEPSADLCLHKNLYLANVHHLAVKRDGVQSIRIK